MNLVVIQGFVGGDTEIKRLENGTAVGKLNVATTSSWKDSAGEWQEKTQWHSVVVWRHLAEKAEKHAKKGSFVTVQGSIEYREYEKTFKQLDGSEFKAKVYTSEIVASSLDIKDIIKKEKNNDTNFPTQETGVVVPVAAENGAVPYVNQF